MADIVTDRLILRHHTIAHLSALAAIIGDPVTMSFYPWPYDLAATRGWIERSIQRREECGVSRMAILLKGTGEMIGDAGLVVTGIDGAPATDIGWIVHRDHWRRGYATEAARALIAEKLSRPGLPPLRAHMAWDNIPSRKVALALGMTHIGDFHSPRNRGTRHTIYGLPDRSL